MVLSNFSVRCSCFAINSLGTFTEVTEMIMTSEFVFTFYDDLSELDIVLFCKQQIMLKVVTSSFNCKHKKMFFDSRVESRSHD
eukprot:UN25250